jgi:hypothetical protein
VAAEPEEYTDSEDHTEPVTGKTSVDMSEAPEIRKAWVEWEREWKDKEGGQGWFATSMMLKVALKKGDILDVHESMGQDFLYDYRPARIDEIVVLDANVDGSLDFLVTDPCGTYLIHTVNGEVHESRQVEYVNCDLTPC